MTAQEATVLYGSFATTRIRRVLAELGLASDTAAVGPTAGGGVCVRVPVPVTDPLAALCENGSAAAIPYVVDPDTGQACRRISLGPADWIEERRLRARLTGETSPDAVAQLKLSLALSLSGGGELRLGRSRRVALLAEQRPPLLSAYVLPQGLRPPRRTLESATIRRLCRLLLLRSGATENDFHLVRVAGAGGHPGTGLDAADPNALLARVERALPIPLRAEPRRLNAQAARLLKAAEEDRRIVELFLSERIPRDARLPAWSGPDARNAQPVATAARDVARKGDE